MFLNSPLLSINSKFKKLLISVLCLSPLTVLADTINRDYTVNFGTQAISAPIRVSNIHPITSKMISLPAVNCAECRGNAKYYTYDVEWISENAYLDTERTNLITNANGSGTQVWVFLPPASEIGGARNIETLIKFKGSIGNTTCQTVSATNNFYQCELKNTSGNSVQNIDLEVGVLITGSDVQPGDFATLDRGLLTRVVTFRKDGEEIAKYKDTVKVKGSTTIASCNVNAGSLIFNLPARAIINDPQNSKAINYNNYGVKTQPPTDAVRQELRLKCVGNTELNIQFSPITGTLEDNKILLAKKMDDSDSKLGFQVWFSSSEWLGAKSFQLVKWDNTLTGLLSADVMPTPRGASAADIILSFIASYAIGPSTTLDSGDAGAIIAKGMYTLSYQ